MAELTRLGRYQLRRVLGRGAMGVVYEGLDPSLNRRVAVKTILRNAAIDAETAQHYSAQFAREAQAAGRLNHPHIVQVHDFAEEGDVAYLVMEYIQGRELRSFFEAKESFAPAEAVRIMGELLDALDFAHEAGVIHRDVKPANVMLDAQRRVKLADFGVARIQDSDRSAAGTMVGTPAFMSPEQIQGLKIDRRTDIFSAGTLLYQLLTGEQPFTGQGAWTVAKKIMQDEPPQPSSVVKSISPAFDAVVGKALAKNPAQRYARARDFAEALRAALAPGQPPASASPPPAAPRPGAKATEAEVEFWRAIQNSADPAEFDFYLEQFPDGTYAQLARHKIAKLKEPAEAERKAAAEAEEAARKAAEARAQQAKQAAEEKAAREAAEKAAREAEERAKREAEEKAKREAEALAKRATEEKARQAAALARLKQQQEAAERAKAAADMDATVAIAPARSAAPATAPAPQPARKLPLGIAAAVAALLLIGGIAAYLLSGRAPAPAPVAEVAPPKPAAAPVVDAEKIRRETEERLRREFAEKSAAERAAMEKAVAEKLAAERAAAEKLAQAKTAAEKAAAEKSAALAAAERAAAEKAAAEKAAASKAAAEKANAERAAAEKAAAEKAAAEKAAAEKAAAAKAAAARKPGWPAVGDRWVYEAKDSDNPGRRFQITVEATSVGAGGVGETVHRGNGQVVEVTHRPVLHLRGISPGIVNFSPYLRTFKDLREGESWNGIDYRQLFRCNAGFDCSVSGHVAGRERVTVKAGSFDTTKVVLDVYASNSGGGRAVIELRYWFAEAANRYVKYELRTTSTNFSQPQMDMELVSYAPAAN
jgi:hypothetical protein